jgi:hypothetical protein
VAVLKPREKLVYFRISEDEFRQFVSVCEQAGARSVSDLARSAVQRLIADGNRQREDDDMAQKMYRLERLIAAVTEQLQLLAATQPGVEAQLQFAKGGHESCSVASLVDQNGRREE